MKKLREEANFSIWCDFIERDFLENEFLELLNKNIINGVTSNPAIFKSAILTSNAYKEDLAKLTIKDPKEKYEILALKDIKNAALILENLYKNQDDGFVSIEVDPNFCHDSKSTIEEAKKLQSIINKENIMIKIPATKAGYKAIEELISDGISVNTTLVFSPLQALMALEAYKKGYGKLKTSHIPKGVISVFVSRFDRKLDKKLEKNGIEKGLIGIYNATKIYHLIENFGLKNIKCLFASTGVKGDEYAKDYYISNLLYKNSINTAPIETIKAFIQNKNHSIIKPIKIKRIDKFFEKVKNADIDMQQVYEELINEGLTTFIEAFKEIMDELKEN